MIDRFEVASLIQRIRDMEAAGAGGHNHPDNEKRGQLLDELQDRIGLGGKMMLESDIVKKAEKLLAAQG